MPSPFIPLVSQDGYASLPFASPNTTGILGSGSFGLNQDYASLGTAPDGLLTSQVALPTPAATPGGGLFDSLKGWGQDSGFLGKTLPDGTKVNGWGGTALGLGQGLVGAYMGMQQLKVAKQQLAEGKRQFDMNYGAQRQTTNTALEDRQRARVASNEGAYESVGSYMARNGVK